MSYQSPRIPTDLLTKDQLPDPTEQSLQMTMLQMTPVQPVEVYQRYGGVIVPDAPLNYGWRAPQVDNQIAYMYQPLQAPDVPRTWLSYPKQVAQAANPIPTLGATGLIGPLRAPGINEGY